MIIVIQNKAAIINFENIETLFLLKKGDRIEVNAGGKYDYVIADYKTLERAKEVLQEIIEIHRVAIPTAVYEMPEE